MAEARSMADPRGENTPSESTPSGSARVALVERFYVALHGLELAAIFDALSPTIEMHHAESAPWAGSHYGYAGVRRFLEQFVLSVDAQFGVTSIADNDNLIVTGQLRGRARATGAPFDARFTHTWTTANGLLARLDAALDLEPLAHALSMARLPTLTVTRPTSPPIRERRLPGRRGGVLAPSRAARRGARPTSQIDLAAAARLLI